MEEVRKVSAEFIIDPENPMRTELDRDAIYELSESIRREGLINPITVRPVDVCETCGVRLSGHQNIEHEYKNIPKFEVVAGHRRFRACLMAGVLQISCVVRDMSDEKVNEIMAHENLFREDVDPVDEAIFLGRLIGDDESKIKEVAEKMNHTVAWVQSRLDLLTYPENMLMAIKQGQLKLGVAEWLAQIDDEFWRDQYVNTAINNGMSVVQARYLHDQYSMGITPKSSDILPATEDLAPHEIPRARAICAKCGIMAVDPNMTSVFIHRECPDEGGTMTDQLSGSRDNGEHES